jgi:hypothetical protein
MLNILDKNISEDNSLIEKFSKEEDVDTTYYVDFLNKHKKDSETEYNYLSFLLSKHVDWLKENS